MFIEDTLILQSIQKLRNSSSKVKGQTFDLVDLFFLADSENLVSFSFHDVVLYICLTLKAKGVT